MKSASNTLPDQPVNEVTSGVDEARDDHAVSVVGSRGRETYRCTVEHSVAHRVGLANQLSAHLRNAFPGAVGLFADLDSEISLALLTRFDTQDRADWLTPIRLGKWLTSLPRSGLVRAARLLAEIGDCRARFPTPESLACLAGAWLFVWHCWQTREAFDPSRHNALQRVLAQQNPTPNKGAA